MNKRCECDFAVAQDEQCCHEIKLRNDFVIDYFTQHSLSRPKFEGSLVRWVKSTSFAIASGEEQIYAVVSNDDYGTLSPEPQPLMKPAESRVDDNDD